MTIYVKNAGTWREISQPYVNQSGTWRTVDSQSVKDGGTWRSVFSGVEKGELYLWGENAQSPLGDNTNVRKSTPVTTFAGGNTWTEIAAGNSAATSAAIKTDGTLWVWGRNNNTILAINDNDGIIRSTPVTTFAGGTTWKKIALGQSHAAAIKTDGTLWTWGLNTSGQLGNNTVTHGSTPVTTFAGGTTWKEVACGANFTLAITTGGALWTWGINSTGQLGDNTLINRSTPVTTFAGGTNWKQCAANLGCSYSIKTDGTLWNWGINMALGAYQQLGLNSNTPANVLTPVTTFAGGTNWKELNSAGVIQNAASFGVGAIKTDGTLWIWGIAANGNNTTGIPNLHNNTPITTFAGGTNWKRVCAGYQSSAAIKTDGTLWTWGVNGIGQLGNNTVTTAATPVTTFAGGTTWKKVISGGAFMLAIK